MSRIPFGLRADGTLVDAVSAKRGKACNCVCPECRRALVARQGSLRVEHFAHLADSDCWHGAETSVRMAAHQALAGLPWIDVPAVDVAVERRDAAAGLFQARGTFHDVKRVELSGPHVAAAGIGINRSGSETDQEVRTAPLRSDYVLLSTPLGPFAVFVRTWSRQRTSDLELLAPALEIDLRCFQDECPPLDALTRFVRDQLGNKHWLRHPLKAKYEHELMSGFDRWKLDVLTRLDQERLQRAAAEHAGQQMQQAAAERRAQIRERHRAYSESPESAKWDLLATTFAVPPTKWPEAIFMPDEHAPVFRVPGRLWQADFFARFVFRCSQRSRHRRLLSIAFAAGASANGREDHAALTLSALAEWVALRHRVVPGAEGCVAGEVQRYLQHLGAKRYLSGSADGYQVLHEELEPDESRESALAAWRDRGRPHVDGVGVEDVMWREAWPERETLHRWAAEAATSLELGDAFRPRDFTVALLELRVKPTAGELITLLKQHGAVDSNHLQGPYWLIAVLKHMGLTEDSWRMLRRGNPPPWDSK